MECRGIDDCWIYLDVYIPNGVYQIKSKMGGDIGRWADGTLVCNLIGHVRIIDGKEVDINYSLTEYHQLFATKCDKGHWHYNVEK